MKKNILIIMTILLIGILVIGCEEVEKLPDMYINLGELTEEEKDILDLFNLKYNYEIYDYNVDENVKYREINLYEFKDGKWENLGSVSGQQDGTKGRILMYFDDEYTSFVVSEQDENGYTQYEMDLDKLDGNLAKVGTHIVEPTEIIYGEEIGIKIAILSSQDGVSIMKLDHFFDKVDDFDLDKHEKVYGVTIMFDDKVHE